MPIPTNPINGILEQTPDTYQTAYRLRISRNNRKGRIEIQTSKDGGVTYQVLIPEATSKTRPGSVPTLLDNGNVEWQVPTPPENNAASVVTYAELNLAGTLSVNQQFGFFSAPARTPLKCIGIQASLQTPSAGTAVRFDLVSLAGVEAGRRVTIPVGAEYAQLNFPTPLLMSAGSSWRGKVTQIGNTTPGEFLSIRLVLTPA